MVSLALRQRLFARLRKDTPLWLQSCYGMKIAMFHGMLRGGRVARGRDGIHFNAKSHFTTVRSWVEAARTHIGHKSKENWADDLHRQQDTIEECSGSRGRSRLTLADCQGRKDRMSMAGLPAKAQEMRNLHAVP